MFSGGFWSQADPQASLGSNPRTRVNKPLTPPPPPSQNLSSQVRRPPAHCARISIFCSALSHVNSALFTFDFCLCSQMLYQFPASESQSSAFFVGGPMVIDSLADSCQQAPPPAPLTPAPPPPTPACVAGPSFTPQSSETSFDCSHCGKSLRSRKNYSKHMFIHSGKRERQETLFSS